MKRIRSNGFTLIELLVVISIVALLIALFLPALSNGREAGRRTACLSNQRQIGTAMYAYANEYRNFFPMAYYWVDANGNYVPSNIGNEASWDTIRIGSVARPGLIWQYTSDYRVQQCPSFTGNSNTPADRYTGYNYNTSFIGRGASEGNWGDMTTAPARQDDLLDPVRTALTGDGGYSPGANKYMRAPDDNGVGLSGSHAGGQAFRHAQRTNVLWADGHGSVVATSHKHHSGPAPFLLSMQGYPTNGFLSEDNSLYDRK